MELPDHEGVPDAELFEYTPLDATIDRIGMGKYQWSLFVLCGFGWLGDNMWMQAVSISMARVQDHYSVSDDVVPFISTSLFFGMMVGAIAWGNYSDVKGRKPVFNATLLLTAIFGAFVTLSMSFIWLCMALFLLGSAIGGSMPTDGTIFLENIPRRRRSLLVFMSVFFSLGAVLTAIIAFIVIPSHSCPLADAGQAKPPCDVSEQNQGWKYLMFGLTLLTISMYLCRLVLFHMYESPKWLVNMGRLDEAAEILANISKKNGNHVQVLGRDVADELISTPLISRSFSSMTIPRASTVDEVESDPMLPPHSEDTPHPAKESSSSFVTFPGSKFLPKQLAKPVTSWYHLTQRLFVPRWKRTTVLMWGIWTFTAAGSTFFNVFFPKQVEYRLGKEGEKVVDGDPRVTALWDVLLYSAAGIPGAILGAYAVGTSLGRRKSLGWSCAVTGLMSILFAITPSNTGVIVTSMGASLSSYVMWAVQYGMTPEMFSTDVRGTACGNASALNRISGVIVPIIGGLCFSINASIPVYASAVCYFIASACAFSLPFETAEALEASAAKEPEVLAAASRRSYAALEP